eukprot:gb/GFBE01067708.1/.p1 GENE.gb/GFBE01067708.1/~~gb/GFBE01067708.1/.p1  ORF type:complete len:114 (+),score=3.97 gb/GFBE01067708.1/:1-342(+)
MSQELERPVLFNFTCMEMTNNSSAGVPAASSARLPHITSPSLSQVKHHVHLAGENAIEFDPASSQWAFDQMAKQVRNYSSGYDRMHSLTLLRLGDAFVKQASLEKLGNFASRL